MTTYRFSGKVELGRGKHGFEREVDAESKKHAKHTLYSELGSEHSISRGKIDIDEIEEVE